MEMPTPVQCSGFVGLSGDSARAETRFPETCRIGAVFVRFLGNAPFVEVMQSTDLGDFDHLA